MKPLSIKRTLEEQQLQLANRARNSRLYSGYTQETLANSSHVSYSTIRKFEQTGEISLKSLLRIANTLGEDDPSSILFKKAEFFEYLNPKLFKRPKRCKDGSYNPARKPSKREMEECE